MSYVGWAILIICTLTGGSLFFSVNVISLRIFSRVKLQEAFKRFTKEEDSERLTDELAENAENLSLACGLYRLIFHMCILLILVDIFTNVRKSPLNIIDYILTFIIALGFFGLFGLAIPHAWAKYSGEKVLSRTYKLLTFFEKLATPLLWPLRLHDGIVRRLAGVPESTPQERQEEKQEEFLNGLEQRRMEGVVDAEQQHMIESVLELSETAAGEIMTPRTDIVAIEVNSQLNVVIDTITRAGHTRVPVYEENIDNIIGMVYAKDLLSEIGRPAENFTLREKIRQAYFVPESKPLRVLLHEFQNQKLHIAVVLDEYGGTAGIITLEDILEELVGEITDEYEMTPPKPIKKIDENIFEVDARTHIDDLNDEADLNLPEEEDFDTLGGFVFSFLGYIPKTGEIFERDDLKFTIISAETRRIKRIRIEKLVTRQS